MTGPVLFIGDSITDAGRRDDPDGLGRGYVRLAAEGLARRGDHRTIVNRGIGGDRIGDLRERWQADAIELAPSVLTVYIGINDTWRRFDRGMPTSAAHFESVYRGLLEEALAASNPRLILVEPFLTPVRDEQREWLDDLDGKRAAVASLATEFAAAFVPLHRVLTVAALHHGAAAIAADGVHPTPLGSELIAESWEAAEGASAA
ncbi:SGNH/GDSL hydrolase family protein [Protaetiibacter mangrovi]|uniref:SGNH/GDSL hydrolase family protein n=1 Tax=Protaetiibacter mangrovi TaxID=2970926 RepID=A0ABT1ZH06_9MICO|nr:SGNH/GDSL hydrolase family protein [Protaetiibacter mangrovi]MCS0499994.1 SGNH/GDSL hydrolase family protein [Protaetiibacter mangrovi]TPX02079.1 SGNH/GDSL hydrolase family protein [Schumannella luteola]